MRSSEVLEWCCKIWNSATPHHVKCRDEVIKSTFPSAISGSACKTDYPFRVLSFHVAAYHMYHKQKSNRTELITRIDWQFSLCNAMIHREIDTMSPGWIVCFTNRNNYCFTQKQASRSLSCLTKTMFWNRFLSVIFYEDTMSCRLTKTIQVMNFHHHD